MSRRNLLLLISASLILQFSSCTSNEIGNVKDVNPESIYFDYKVWGDEDAGFITVRLQYRFAGPAGTTLLLQDPSKAELDGEVIKADSSKMNGAYYEITKTVKEFTGRHAIVFTDINGKEYKEEFSFEPLTLKTNVPKIVDRSDLVFDLDGLAPKDYVRVIVSDTAKFSEGIVRVDTVLNGRITITKHDLESLLSGPIHLEFARDDEKRIKNGTRQGGRMTISYELKREMELK